LTLLTLLTSLDEFIEDKMKNGKTTGSNLMHLSRDHKIFSCYFFLASHLSLLREEKESCGHSSGIEGKPYMLPVYLSKEL